MPYGAATPQPPTHPAAPRSVLAELLDQHYRTHPRALLVALPFALLALWVLRNALPHTFLAAWAILFFAVNLVRAVAARTYSLTPPEDRDERPWARRAVAGHAFGGIAWGILGAGTIVMRPEAPEYALIIFFIFAIFATFQVANPSRYPPAYYAWLAASMGPTLIAALLQDSEVYRSLVALGAIFVFTVSFVGRHSHRLMLDSISKELERSRLLDELIAKSNALDEANRAKTRFLAAASHDLRQPMQAAVLLVESLQERTREAENRRIVESIRNSVISMSALLNAILDVSRFDAGTVKPERSHFPVAQVLDRLRGQFAQAAKQKHLEFRVRPCDAVVETDPILLYRVLVNFCNNALQYTAAGGVLVGCRRRGAGVVIEVWDTGVGIAADKHREIFREFHQLANPQRDRGQGLGLGLAIVERTAGLLGHALALRSRPGRGSVFSIAVPVGDAAQVRAVDRPAIADLAGCTVLVIEDEAEIRAAMTILLEGWQCRVLAAASASEADAVLGRAGRSPDVLLVDYRLPGHENGVKLLQRLQQLHPGAGAILITGDVDPAILREAGDAGCQILHKPLRPARLRSLLGGFWRARTAAARDAAPTVP